MNSDYNIDNVKVILELSKEAMIGLGSQFIRLKQKGIPDEIDIRTEPLKTSWGAAQPLGFYLIPDSATLFVYHKEYGTLKDNNIGIYLTNNSPELIVRCKTFKGISEYDDTFKIR